MRPEVKDALRQVDWLRVMHRLTTLARSLRGDAADLEADHHAERSRAGNVRRTFEAAARESMNCRAPSACACPLCGEENQP